MRVLHISKYYYPFMGGMEKECRYLVEEMGEGYETSVVCFGEGRKDEVDEVDGHRVYRVGTWMNVARQALSPTYFGMLRRALREEEPDIIHFHWANPFAAWVLILYQSQPTLDTLKVTLPYFGKQLMGKYKDPFQR